ncbi:glycosyltransferase [Azoarcus olearius]|uniref:Glycosyltransferase n=2 Tax=Azoarcus sp. (strain BH72) TaxID=418699 RepID=A1KAM1_AZOSB|nr:glycosyltransferase [Azoarcus olearius]
MGKGPQAALPVVAGRKILLTSRSGQLGGMELRMADEARFLASDGHRCVLAPSDFPDRHPWIDQLAAENPLFSTLDFNPPPFFEQWQWRRTNHLLSRAFWLPRLRRVGVDFAHVFYAWTQEGGSRIWLCHRLGIPTVLSVHNAFPRANFSPWHAELMREAFGSVRGLYAVSASALDHFLATYGDFIRRDAVVTVIPNFVDVDRFAPRPELRTALRRELGIPESARVVGAVGRLDVQKQPLQMLEVFDRLWAQRRDIYLVLCGRGPLEPQVRAEVSRREWADRVRILGFQPDVENVFQMLDVHLLLSRQEGFGIATAEAMACGLPVVATDVPGSRDVVADGCGTLVPFGDAAAAATAVAGYFDDPDASRNAGIAGRARACRYYSPAVWRGNLKSFYSATLPHTGHRHQELVA